nr:glycosyltransferase [Bradyrhizobium oropedii]
MRAAGHAVRVWTYSPEKLAFLAARGIELRNAADVIPKALFERVVARSEVRFFSDIFRYAVLYEHGGLWMDSDVILLKPFPFIGDYFFNLQWRGGHRGHFICGNVIFAKPFSHHIRTLYERSIDCLYGPDAITFGDVGPKLLSDYIASAEGYALRAGVFSPIFFNAIDWTELDKFNRPAAELPDYLNDDRVFGIHLWTARNQGNAESPNSLIAQLTQSENGPASFTDLADRFNTDKNRHTGNRHCYARVYDRLLSDRRLSLSRLMEIGLCRGLAEGNQTETPSVALWQSYFPFCHVTGVDLTDFSTLNDAKFTSYVCDQSKRDQLRALTAKLEPGSFDVIIDDGSHVSLDEQQTLIELFPLLADGGWYFLEDLDWQPPGEDPSKITLTKTLLKEIARDGKTISLDPFGVSAIANQMDEILFFDSHYELTRAKLMGGLVAIRKQSGTESVR